MSSPIWRPSPQRVAASNMAAFARAAGVRAGRRFDSYADLHAWSVGDPAAFWARTWEAVGLESATPWREVVDDPGRLPGARWFEGATLNFAQRLLAHRDERPAIVAADERGGPRRRLSYAELHRQVARAAAALRAAGVGPGDRVAGYMPNIPETVIAMLAATSLGAVWSSCSPDFGVQGVLDRFARIAPRVLFAADGYHYGGKRFDCLDKVRAILAGLDPAPRTVIVPFAEDRPRLDCVPGAVAWPDFVGRGSPPPIAFAPLPFAHPVYIMYSSGTTGLPKCIVQPAGGILLNQLKEHVLHVDLRREDAIFYFTTCGWMMWNWLVAALGTGATILLWDGSPFHPDPLCLWRLAAEEGVSVFGTSASYLAALEKSGARPGRDLTLPRLRSVLSTGSPLSDESFDYVYRDIAPDVLLGSISGGTDLNGCFVGSCPLLPVYRGEIQCRFLGMDVHAWDDEGRSVVGETGELVCTKAFPAMPIGFFGDEDGSAYRAAYFERFPGVWTHGDFISINDRGGVRIFGRSDATLNPGGVRIGTAEIYRVVERLPGIADSVVIGQRWGNDVRVILFVRMAGGKPLTEELIQSIRQAIRAGCSPRHVPARIVEVADIPYTRSGKKVELAVRNVVHGEPVKNREALRNPEALECFAGLEALAR
jgi:acetoacetyl-CoA synthetase